MWQPGSAIRSEMKVTFIGVASNEGAYPPPTMPPRYQVIGQSLGDLKAQTCIENLAHEHITRNHGWGVTDALRFAPKGQFMSKGVLQVFKHP